MEVIMFTSTTQLDAKVLKHQVVPMSLLSNGPLIDRAYREALEHQYDRELIQNAIEAGAKEVMICPDWIHLNQCKESGQPLVYRYLFCDNGKGMSAEELINYFNNLSASGHDLNGFNNFGMGAKISMLPWNSEGLIIMSWHNDTPQGSMIRTVKRTTDKNYGLFLWQDEEGLFQKTAIPPKIYKETFLPKSATGTIVIALGSSLTEDTYFGPRYNGEQAPATAPTHSKMLNTRYFSLPEGMKVRTVSVYVNDKNLWGTTVDTSWAGYHRVNGASTMLSKFSHSNGVVSLSDTKVHWWIIDPEKSDGKPFHRTSFVSAMVGNELYNTQVGRNARSRYNQFGLLFEEVKKRVVLIVEPTKNLNSVYYPNTPRSALMCSATENLDLPWAQWGMEFVENMPKEIRDLCDQYGSPVDVSKKSIKDRLKEFLIRLQPNFKKTEKGTEKGSAGTIPILVGISSSSSKAEGKHQKNPAKLNEGNVMGRKVSPRSEPPIPIWVNAIDMTEEAYGAEFVESSNTVKINKDFFLFKEVTSYWLSKYDIPGVEQRIIEAVRDVYQLKLVALIIHAYSMGSKPEWASTWKNLLLPEALTASILGIILEHVTIQQRLAGLGIKKASE